MHARRNHNKSLDLSSGSKFRPKPEARYAPHPVQWIQHLVYSNDPSTAKPYSDLKVWMTGRTARELHRKSTTMTVAVHPQEPTPKKILGFEWNELSAMQSNGVIVITSGGRVIGCRFFGDLT